MSQGPLLANGHRPFLQSVRRLTLSNLPRFNADRSIIKCLELLRAKLWKFERHKSFVRIIITCAIPYFVVSTQCTLLLSIGCAPGRSSVCRRGTFAASAVNCNTRLHICMQNAMPCVRVTQFGESRYRQILVTPDRCRWLSKPET